MPTLRDAFNKFQARPQTADAYLTSLGWEQQENDGRTSYGRRDDEGNMQSYRGDADQEVSMLQDPQQYMWDAGYVQLKGMKPTDTGSGEYSQFGTIDNYYKTKLDPGGEWAAPNTEENPFDDWAWKRSPQYDYSQEQLNGSDEEIGLYITLGLMAAGVFAGFAGFGGALTGEAAAAASTGAAGAAANASGLALMGGEAGLAGAGLSEFVASGGILGSTTAAEGLAAGTLTAAGVPVTTGLTGAAANTLGLAQMGTQSGLTGQALEAFIQSGGTLGSTAAGGGGVQSIMDAASQWMTGDVVQPTGTSSGVPGEGTTGPSELSKSTRDLVQLPGESGAPSVPGENTTGMPEVTKTALDTPNTISNAAKTAKDLVGNPVSSALNSVLDWAKQNDKLSSALVTGGLQVLGGMGQASLAQDTVKLRAELEAKALADAQTRKQTIAGENAFKGTVGIRPATARAPLTRLSSGAPVYGVGGILNARR